MGHVYDLLLRCSIKPTKLHLTGWSLCTPVTFCSQALYMEGLKKWFSLVKRTKNKRWEKHPSMIKCLFSFWKWGAASSFNLSESPAHKYTAEFTEWWYLFPSSAPSMEQTDRHGDRLFYSRACGTMSSKAWHWTFNLDITSTWGTQVGYARYQF